MGNNNDIRVVLGSLRYKSAPNVDFSLKVPLVQTFKENVEYDRISDINLQQIYDDERQASTTFRPACKFSVLFKNSYAGETNYPPFENNMYLLNVEGSAASQCALGPNTFYWSGLPQYNEFDFIRTDYDVTGYTQPPNQHLIFTPQSAATYNWNFYLSFPYVNDPNKYLFAIEPKTQQTLSWQAKDGIPFIIQLTQYNGRDYISFICLVKHGLSVNEFVQLSFDYNGRTIFPVESLGLQTFQSDEYVFSFANPGFTGNTFIDGVTGTFKRVIIDSSTADTISSYYVRRNKIVTNPEDAVLTKAGFEQNIFGTKKKYESAAYTPNNESRISIKEGGQSYTLSFNKDFDIKNELDNLGRPLTELYFTVIWKGYFGWTNGVLRQGYEFNLPLEPVTNLPSTWWNSGPSNTFFPTNTWTNTSGNTFSYVRTPQNGDIVDGDLCEWNNFDQTERVISNLYHKFIFNPLYFTLLGVTPQNQFRPLGYYYQPHHRIVIREYSDYIETSDTTDIENFPNYAYYSTTLNQFIWRDIYTYGFIDSVNNIGVNYPFLNKAHYPFENYIFRIIPEGTNYTEQTAIADPTTDDCE